MREFSVLGCGLFTPHFHSVGQWLEDAPFEEAVAPKGASLDRRSRRISGELMRALTDAAHDAIIHAEVDPATVASVYGSALGEVQTMVKLLQQIWKDKEAPSPMAFAASVHNAASGVASISHKNQAFTTSMAANFDTPAMSLIEAIALLATGTPEVLIACGDEPSPNDLMGEHPTWSTLCSAVVLSADSNHPKRLATIAMPTLHLKENVRPLDVSDELRNNPSFGLLKLVDTIVRQRQGVVRLDAGEGRGWCVEVRKS